MMNEAEISHFLVAFLKRLGYPEDTIILGWKITEKLRLDLAIIDPKLKRPIALFEIKNEATTIASAKEQVKRYAQAIGDKTVPIYIVIGKSHEPFFEIFPFLEENSEGDLKPIELMPSFTSLRNRSISKKLIQTENEKKKTFDGFKITCWLLAGMIVGLFILDFLNKVKLTPERLGIIAIIAGLIILPFARKLNILGVEFERLQEDGPGKK